MQPMLQLINQLYELEQKAQLKGATDFERNFERMKDHLADLGYTYHNPIHEVYSDTRTDCAASIVGELKEPMVISKVVKPVIYFKDPSGPSELVQKAVVIVEHKA